MHVTAERTKATLLLVFFGCCAAACSANSVAGQDIPDVMPPPSRASLRRVEVLQRPDNWWQCGCMGLASQLQLQRIQTWHAQLSSKLHGLLVFVCGVKHKSAGRLVGKADVSCQHPSARTGLQKSSTAGNSTVRKLLQGDSETASKGTRFPRPKTQWRKVWLYIQDGIGRPGYVTAKKP